MRPQTTSIRLCSMAVFAGLAAVACLGRADYAQAQGGVASFYHLDINRDVSSIGLQGVEHHLFNEHFFHRPTVSPYLNLDRFDPVASTSFHSFVQPERERRQRLAQQQRAYVDARRREGRIGETRFVNPHAPNRPPARPTPQHNAARFNYLGNRFGGR